MDLNRKDIAELRLAVWNSLSGWGVPQTTILGDKEYTDNETWTWEQRKVKANELMDWLLSPLP